MVGVLYRPFPTLTFNPQTRCTSYLRHLHNLRFILFSVPLCLRGESAYSISTPTGK